MFALVAAFLVLAAIGATLGWTLTDTSSGAPLATPSLTASVPATPTSPTPKPSPSPSTNAPTTAPAGMVVPDFAKKGVSFIDARNQLMSLKIQGVPVFLGGNGGDTVVHTTPDAGAPMSKGITIKLYVNEDPPLLPVPPEHNKACKSAGSDLAKTGFRPAYPTGTSGVVQSQNPDTDSKTARWNDTVALMCGPPNASPSASQSSGTASTGASTGPGN